MAARLSPWAILCGRSLNRCVPRICRDDPWCIALTEPQGLLLTPSGESFATGSAAHGLIRGGLHIHRITLVADMGAPLGIDATVFVSPDWRGPCFIGYTGALDRLNFAIHPRDNRFYFGPWG